ncbi:hypothetical protein B4U79_15053 [Dinothrombium tinctorium]|uniref:Ubiquitin-like domain-containing protein n=1 Tax=Dinothrombium tinctorium TaxID=1965070 RepID=A0A3S3P8D7_9ACAR|nr:hypothetical protein B4U79_15053 [Dinothrombium tinctorium]
MKVFAFDALIDFTLLLFLFSVPIEAKPLLPDINELGFDEEASDKLSQALIAKKSAIGDPSLEISRQNSRAVNYGPNEAVKLIPSFFSSIAKPVKKYENSEIEFAERIFHQPNISPIEKPMNILVKTGEGKMFTINVSRETTLDKLKEKIESITGIARNAQRLMFNGQMLEKNRTLDEYNLNDSSIVYVIDISYRLKPFQTI